MQIMVAIFCNFFMNYPLISAILAIVNKDTLRAKIKKPMESHWFL